MIFRHGSVPRDYLLSEGLRRLQKTVTWSPPQQEKIESPVQI